MNLLSIFTFSIYKGATAEVLQFNQRATDLSASENPCKSSKCYYPFLHISVTVYLCLHEKEYYFNVTFSRFHNRCFVPVLHRMEHYQM
jgi:hypothetical protein